MDDRSVRIACAQGSAKSRTVRPSAVRERLGHPPGDRSRAVPIPEGIRIETAPRDVDDPFAASTDWNGAIDDEDDADL
ncbi:AbrB family transcriptional regulator [Methylobacterium planeticum]|uniref:AbrB family transcriptional regulator n=1 Tax=Methylobacterium planeticum TaxID=2615211 RepID=A0A6N6MR35_9HYPH|nr:AbrB family transcriptional regulator [Methylobacterium planeticum]KAB1070978.1 AbrB family transcriptional regulator [Methylobacterium planeticum]